MNAMSDRAPRAFRTAWFGEGRSVMAWVVGTGGVLGLLVIALGIVTLRTGWVLPPARRHVTRHRLHAFGALCTGLSLVLQSLFFFGVLPGISGEVRFLAGDTLLLGGLVLIALGQVLPAPRPRNGGDGGTDAHHGAPSPATSSR